MLTYSCLSPLPMERGICCNTGEYLRSEEFQMATPTSRLGMVLRDPSRLRGAVAGRLQVPVARCTRLHDLRWRLNSRQALFTD